MNVREYTRMGTESDPRPETEGRHTPDQRTREDGPTKLSIGSIVAWVAGIATHGVAIWTLSVGGYVSAIVLFVAAAFGTPPTRALIENELNVLISRWLAVLVWLALWIVAAIV